MAAASTTIGINGNASNTYYPYPSTTTWPTYYPTYTYTLQGEDPRLRLALELIADADSLSEAKRIAAKALRVEADTANADD